VLATGSAQFRDALLGVAQFVGKSPLGFGIQGEQIRVIGVQSR
jgi:hypothetical protein